MKVNFGELLASERVGPLWGRSHTPESAMEELQRLLLLASGQGDPAASGQGPASVDVALSEAPPAGASIDRAADGPAAAARGGEAGPGSGSAGGAGLAGDAAGAESGRAGPGGAAGSPTRAADGVEGALGMPAVADLADVPIRAPHAIFNELEQTLRQELGTRAAMVGGFVEALRVRIHKLDPTAPEAPYHPLRHAAGGTIWELLGRLEDTLSGLRRVAGKR